MEESEITADHITWSVSRPERNVFTVTAPGDIVASMILAPMPDRLRRLEVSSITVTAPPGASVSQRLLRAVPVNEVEAIANGTSGDIPEYVRLQRPGRITRDFLASVAAAYRYYVFIGVHPAPAIADDADVPAATVRGWILSARKAGMLMPGRRGRAG